MMCHVASGPEPINHDVKVELVKAGPERCWSKEGSFQSMFRVVK